MDLAESRPVARSSPELVRESSPEHRPPLASQSGRGRPPNPNHPSRLVALDAARVVATFGVLWVHVVEVQGHSADIAALGRFGTSFYVVAAVLLAYRTTLARPARTLRDGNWTRAKRLLVPYVLWCAIYGAFYGYHAYVQGHSFEALSVWWGPFAGTARHLWFLPFAFATGAAIQPLVKRLSSLSERALLRGTVVATAVAYAFFYGYVFFAIDHDLVVRWHLHRLDRWVEEIPLATFALFSSAYFHKSSVRARFKEKNGLRYGRQLALLALVLGVQTVYFLLIEDLRELNGAEGRYLANVVGIALLAAFLDWGENSITKKFARLGKYTYFAFLSHVLLLDAVGIHLQALPGFGTVGFGLGTTVVLFAVCLGLGWLVRRWAPLRWLSP